MCQLRHPILQRSAVITAAKYLQASLPQTSVPLPCSLSLPDACSVTLPNTCTSYSNSLVEQRLIEALKRGCRVDPSSVEAQVAALQARLRAAAAAAVPKRAAQPDK